MNKQDYYNSRFADCVRQSEKALRGLGPKGLMAAGIRRRDIGSAAIAEANEIIEREWRTLESETFPLVS